MLDIFDRLQEQLMDEIDPSTNTVGHFIKQIYTENTPDKVAQRVQGFASGGFAGAANGINNGDDVSTYQLQKISNEANQSVTSPSNKFANVATGENFYNSPVYLMQHYSNLGKFFNQAEPGNKYSDRYEPPIKQPTLQAEDPNTFYNDWYQKMRNFAEAKEASNSGAVEVRSR